MPPIALGAPVLSCHFTLCPLEPYRSAIFSRCFVLCSRVVLIGCTAGVFIPLHHWFSRCIGSVLALSFVFVRAFLVSLWLRLPPPSPLSSPEPVPLLFFYSCYLRLCFHAPLFRSLVVDSCVFF